ncbi:MAG: nuclear transport factor 2-like protein [Acidimicrobiales bacterium]
MEFDRQELEQTVQSWLAANQRAQELGDWSGLAELYCDDATYGWNLGPGEEFMAVGIDEIREIALGSEMVGLEGWKYPYERVLIDDHIGEVVGFWRQQADSTRPDGSPYDVQGIGGSWFGYGGNGKWAWQRDFFDFGNVTALFVEMIQAGALSDGMRRRIENMNGRPPGHYRLGHAPASLWPGR